MLYSWWAGGTDVTLRRHVKRLGRRGGLLLLLAALWAGVAAQVAVTRAPYDVADAVLHERIPTEWRVGLWLAAHRRQPPGRLHPPTALALAGARMIRRVCPKM